MATIFIYIKKKNNTAKYQEGHLLAYNIMYILAILCTYSLHVIHKTVAQRQTKLATQVPAPGGTWGVQLIQYFFKSLVHKYKINMKRFLDIKIDYFHCLFFNISFTGSKL